jgi:hypothetical protein
MPCHAELSGYTDAQSVRHENMVSCTRRAAGGRSSPTPGAPRSAAARLAAAEALFQDFKELTPFAFVPFARSFDSWEQYERWRRAQTNPWYR